MMIFVLIFMVLFYLPHCRPEMLKSWFNHGKHFVTRKVVNK